MTLPVSSWRGRIALRMTSTTRDCFSSTTPPATTYPNVMMPM